MKEVARLPGERRAELVIAGEEEFGEEYLCRIVDASARGHDPPPSPLVRVLAVISYPAQRAIMQPDAVNEVPPLHAGLVCRLPVLRTASIQEAELARDPAAALDAALSRALEDARSEKETEILLRHKSGQIRRRRIMISS